ncbi:SGNH/GDSL hydrolase family protein [Blastococcus sp. SYSU D00695]
MRSPLGPRARCSLLALLTATALAACGSDDDPGSGGAAPESSATSSSAAPAEVTYLALGDSVPFGYIGNDPDGYEDEDAFVGYPELVAEDEDLELLNATCPGETTASFLDEAAQSNGCTNDRGQEPGFRDQYPLHADYDGPQVDEAVRVLQEGGVELVTLQIGANDGFICQATGACSDVPGITALAEQVRANVDTILTRLRGDGGYDGRIVVVGYYALDYSDPITTFGIQQINGALTTAAQAHDAQVADAFGAFQPVAEAAGGSTVDAGLVYPDDVHPTPDGQRLLADAVEQVLTS